LIFVSLAEHYARVIAGEGIAARVPPSQWQEVVDTLVAHIRNGRVVHGFIAAIELFWLLGLVPATRDAGYHT
jgi:putative membrane protein